MTTQQAVTADPRIATAATYDEAFRELVAELRHAGRDVVSTWEKGNLAGAVQHLERVLSEFDDFDGDAQ